MEPQHLDVDREQNPRKKANLLSKFCYWYTRPIFEKGRKGQLSISDVYRCMQSHRAAPHGDKLGKKWKEEVQNQNEHKKPSLVRTILSVYGFKFFAFNLLFSIFDTTVRLSIPLCLEGLITYFSPSHGGVSETHAYLYAAGIVGLMILQASMMQPMILWILELGMKIRVACCSLLYRKLLRIDQNAEGKASEGLTGYIINLMTTDAERFDMAALFGLELIRGPIESLIIVYIMYRLIGAASLLGVVFIVLFIPLQAYISKISSKLREKTTVRTDNRIRMMNEVIQSIEAIKMYAWEKPFEKMIGLARRKEMNIIKKMAWLHAVMTACGKLTTKVAVLVSIVSYITIYEELSAAKVYVLFTYYDMLKWNLADFLPFAISSMLEAYVSVKRMQGFLLLREIENRNGIDLITIDGKPTSGKDVSEKTGNGHQPNIKNMELIQDSKPPVLISIQNYTAHWSKTDEDDTLDKKIIALNDINLTIKPDTLTVIIGTVGAGKSTLLQAILGELSPTSGKIDIYGKIAYAPQDPWLFESSIRQNILFGEELDLRRYKKVVQCCQLLPDLDILPHGDQTVVGERGVALSGGQRARISLARCVYQMADVYVLDDPLAAVDAKVAQAIYLDCIKGFLQSKAVVLVTHHVQYATNADHVVVVRNSQITAQGTYEEMRNETSELEKTVKESEHKEEETDKPKNVVYKRQESVERHYKVRSRSMSEASQLSFSMDMDNKMDPDFEDEHQNTGSVSRGVYLAYFRSGGTKWTMLLLAALFVSAQTFYSASDVWLQQWVNIEEEYSAELQTHRNTTPAGNSSIAFDELSQNRFGLTRQQCIYVYGALVAICVLFVWNKLVIFYNTCIKASIALHDSMFRGVTNAPMWFFHHNPAGRILNRFSHDMGQTDTLMPGALVECAAFVLEVVFILIVVCLVNWWLLLPTVVLAVVLVVLRSLYVSTSRELERIEAITNSRTLSHATATVSGLTTIRSCGGQQRTLAQEFDKLQDLHSSAWAMVLVTSRAFEWWMNLLSCAFLACVIGSFFILDQQIASGSVGLAITQVLGLIGMCQFGIRQTAELENHMTSVERILEYRDLPAESPVEPDENALRIKHPRLDIDSWPTKGEIIFQEVSLEYEKPPKQDPPKEEATKETPTKEEANKEPTLAINGVSFTIRPSEKVAVVGRTGAGKSSLISALFRLNRISGSIRVDGVSAEEVGLRTWRSHLCALPQRPALFAASLRDNLDPSGQYSDAQILRALDQVELREMVANLPAGLNSKVGDGGGNLSSGQRQLLCMARAALAGCRVLVLDEATANVDAQTDKHIQETIRNKFAESTVLTIAHRLNTVMDYDRVIVMDKGRVVETGHPYELLTRSNSSAYDSPKKDTLSPYSQAPLATPEDFYFESSQKLNDEFYNLTRRTRTITDNSQAGQVSGIFKTLVEQTGKDTAAMLHKMAEESYNKRVTKKDL